MNGLPVAFYTYNGTQTGHNDPWNQPPPPPKPKPAPKPRLPRSTKNNHQPCGTYPKYGWHRRRGQHCEPCWEAKRAYDKQRRGPQRVTAEARAKKREYDQERYKRLKREGKR